MLVHYQNSSYDNSNKFLIRFGRAFLREYNYLYLCVIGDLNTPSDRHYKGLQNAFIIALVLYQNSSYDDSKNKKLWRMVADRPLTFDFNAPSERPLSKLL